MASQGVGQMQMRVRTNTLDASRTIGSVTQDREIGPGESRARSLSRPETPVQGKVENRGFGGPLMPALRA